MRENITATWAREASSAILGEKVQTELGKCLDAIELAVKRNALSCDVTFSLHDLTKAELVKRGFTMKYTPSSGMDQRESDYHTINW